MEIELDYVKVGDYYLPDLTLEPQPDRSLGKYGLLRLRYLKEHRPNGGFETMISRPPFSMPIGGNRRMPPCEYR